MKKVLLYLYMIFLFIIILDGVLFAFLSAIYLGFFSYEVAFLDIPIIIWGIVNALIFIQIISGIVMFYFDFPFSTQPIHLLLSTIIVGLQFYFLMLYNYRSNEVKI